VEYLILEASGTPAGLRAVYDHPDGWAGFEYLGEMESMRVYRVHP
jgi:hypothetical protein